MVTKARIVAVLVARLEADLERSSASQRATQEGATHAEAKPENDKDTRALEATYLARGLAARVAGLRADLAVLRAMELRAFGEGDPIGLSAVIDLEGFEESAARDAETYFLAPVGGGLRLDVDGAAVVVVTPRSPIGQALVGRSVDDDVRITSPGGPRLCVVSGVR